MFKFLRKKKTVPSLVPARELKSGDRFEIGLMTVEVLDIHPEVDEVSVRLAPTQPSIANVTWRMSIFNEVQICVTH